MSFFAWIDSSTDDRRRVLDAIEKLKEADSLRQTSRRFYSRRASHLPPEERREIRRRPNRGYECSI